MIVEEAYEIVRDALDFDRGRFYRPGTELPLGAGLLYSAIRYPNFDRPTRKFLTLEGLVYVLSHECDTDAANRRPLNDYLLICPVLPFREFVEEYTSKHLGSNGALSALQERRLRAFLNSLATRRAFRLIYLPPLPPAIPYGGVLYFNWIAHTHVSEFAENGAVRAGSVTSYGLDIIDRALQNHLFRPKVVEI